MCGNLPFNSSVSSAVVNCLTISFQTQQLPIIEAAVVLLRWYNGIDATEWQVLMYPSKKLAPKQNG